MTHTAHRSSYMAVCFGFCCLCCCSFFVGLFFKAFRECPARLPNRQSFHFNYTIRPGEFIQTPFHSILHSTFERVSQLIFMLSARGTRHINQTLTRTNNSTWFLWVSCSPDFLTRFSDTF